MQAAALLEQFPNPSVADIDAAMTLDIWNQLGGVSHVGILRSGDYGALIYARTPRTVHQRLAYHAISLFAVTHDDHDSPRAGSRRALRAL
jgi:hypothetical protein